MPQDSSVRIVIPAYNEAASIEAVVRRALEHAPVIVVDDASTDGTGDLAAALPGCTVLRHVRNTHIPGGILDGFRHALSLPEVRTVVTMDAGMSHDPGALPALLAQPEADLVLTYRTESRHKPLHRRLLSWLAARLVNLAIRGRYRDVTSGYRRYSRRAMETVLAAPLVSTSFDFHLEVLAVVHYAGLSVREFPITYVFTNSSLTRRTAFQAFRTWCRLAAGLHRR